ncbi:alpha/beta hydrolase family protein [Casimicrobium huifangae]|uniref:alpha/beta hydrolase family protein n=1 Tax=Casimicrobium huifangae TaxID=2591109 RepID=UPI0012EC9090|nr:S9 family peptidase [Casimicrobium huifangae]
MKAKHLTVDHLWQCERIGTPSISPDGSWVVVDQTTYSMETNESATQLWLYSTDGKTRKQLTSAGKKNTAPQWSPDGKLIAFCAKRGEGKSADEEPQLYVIAPDGGEARRVTSLSTGVGSIKWFPDSKRVAAISWVWPELKTDAQQAKRKKEQKESKVQAKVIETDNYRYWDSWVCDGTRPHLFEINVASGAAKDLFAGKPWTLGLGDPGPAEYAISPDGKEIVWSQPEDPTRLISRNTLIHLSLKSRKSKVTDLGDMWLVAPAYSHDGTRVAVLATPTSAPSQHTRLMLVDLKSGKAERLAAKWPRSVGTYGSANPAWRADDQAILFCAEDAGVQHLWSLPLSAEAPTAIAHGGHVMAFAQSADGATTVFTKASIDHPARLYTLGTDETKQHRLDRTNAFLDKVPLGKWQSRTFNGWNDEPVQAFVCYPPNYDKKKKYPLLHSIHGGPHAAHMDTWHYRWNVHAFAAQGYVVAAVNYHGSSGFDERFLGIIDGDLGHRELTDTEAVTDALIREGVVDKKRLYAAGGSYGGYMVAWMNGHTDRYKAYVCHAGVYNWVSQFGDDGYLWLNQELGCWPWEDLEKYQSQSPHTFSKNFKTPTLVIHGELDYRVPYYEGLEYYNTLRAKGIASRLVVYPDENHWILKPQNSKLWYTEFFNWLKRF